MSEWIELLVLFAVIMVTAVLLSFRRRNSHVKPSKRGSSNSTVRVTRTR